MIKSVSALATALVIAGSTTVWAGHCCQPAVRYHAAPAAPAAPAEGQAPAATPAPVPGQADAGQGTRRSFSYEPGTEAAVPAAPSMQRYRAPVQQYRSPSRGSSKPSYLLPKTDSRRFRGR